MNAEICGEWKMVKGEKKRSADYTDFHRLKGFLVQKSVFIWGI
jgi:hypothetical protein